MLPSLLLRLLQMLLLWLRLRPQPLLPPLLLMLLLKSSRMLGWNIGMETTSIRTRNRNPATQIFKAIEFNVEQLGARTKAAKC